MITKDTHLSMRGDCIAAVGAEVALSDLPAEFKRAARKPDTIITLTLDLGPHMLILTGRGHPRLSYSDQRDMVARVSRHTCERTLMVEADKASTDVPRDMLSELQIPGTVIRVTLTMSEYNNVHDQSGTLF
jgi:hypothetical protein